MTLSLQLEFPPRRGIQAYEIASNYVHNDMLQYVTTQVSTIFSPMQEYPVRIHQKVSHHWVR